MWEIQRTQVSSLGWKDPLEGEMATYSSTLAYKMPWMEEPGRLESTGLQRVGHFWAYTASQLKKTPMYSFWLYGICINCSHLKAELQLHCPGPILPPGDWAKVMPFLNTLPSNLAPFHSSPHSPNQRYCTCDLTLLFLRLHSSNILASFFDTCTLNFPSSHSISSSLLSSSVYPWSNLSLPFLSLCF